MDTKNSSLSPVVAAIVAAQAPRLQEARVILGEIHRLEAGMMADRQCLFEHAWELGRLLTTVKEEVGHGKWQAFLEGQWPQLSQQNAARYMAFFKANPNHGNSGDLTFSTESVRKFMWDYIPVKERPELPGDAAVEPITHHLTFVNTFTKWERQVSLGRVEKPSVEVLRRECAPVVKSLVELLGREFLAELVFGPAVVAVGKPPGA